MAGGLRLLDTVTHPTCNNENGKKNPLHLDRQVAFVTFICKLGGPLNISMLVLPAYKHSSAGQILDQHTAGKINDHALKPFFISEILIIQTQLQIQTLFLSLIV